MSMPPDESVPLPTARSPSPRALESSGWAEGGGHFGEWIRDAAGLPAYRYTCDHARDPRAATRTSEGMSTDHWHQIGNARLTCTCHNDGRVEVIRGDRGLAYASYRNMVRGLLGGGIALVVEEGRVWSDLFKSAHAATTARVFGTGYFEKRVTRHAVEIVHVLAPAPGDVPVIHGAIKVTNRASRPRTLTLLQCWDVRHYDLFLTPAALLYLTPRRRTFGQSRLVNMLLGLVARLAGALGLTAPQVRERFADRFSYHARWDAARETLVLDPEYAGVHRYRLADPAPRDYFPPSAFLTTTASRGTPAWYSRVDKHVRGNKMQFRLVQAEAPGNWGTLAVGRRMTLAPGETCTVHCTFGLAPRGEVPVLVTDARARLTRLDREEEGEEQIPGNSRVPADPREIAREAWRPVLARLHVPGYPWLDREIQWQAHALLSAVLYDRYYRTHYIPQGNAYAYLHGFDGSGRDHVFFFLPALFLDPALGREVLVHLLESMSPSGELPYAHGGFGQLLGALVHETSSDLYVFLLWSVTEYTFLTRDLAFLDHPVRLYPKDAGVTVPVFECLRMAARYLLDEVGLGEHGLVRVGSGDWSDGITLFVGFSRRARFMKHGESLFNSAFLLYMLPRLIPLVAPRDARLADRLRAVEATLRPAVRATWNGRWCYRAYDGAGEPLGDAHLFLEHHPWILLSGVLAPAQARVLVAHVRRLLDDPAPAGQYILYPPVPLVLDVLPRGWDVNGGVWYAINGLWAWALGHVDARAAWRAFLKNTCHHRARAYPDLWYGLWSGPDAYNAHYAPAPGHTFLHPATPQADFPVMNANLPASLLHAAARLAGVEARHDAIVIDPKLPGDEFSFISALFEISRAPSELRVRYAPVLPCEVTFRVRHGLASDLDLQLARDGTPYPVESGRPNEGWATFRGRCDPAGTTWLLKKV